MERNPLRKLWADGRAVLNAWCSIGSSFTAEIMAAQGYDSVTIDMQHGALDYSAALPMFQAIRAARVCPMARVQWLDPGQIMKVLDAGAMGIVCPMINSRTEAETLVSYVRYPPQGQRSFGPTRVSVAMPGYGLAANDEILAFAMIETAQGFENLEEIAATPGLDGIYVGPADLTLSTQAGRLAPGLDRQEDEMIEIIRRIADVCAANGLQAALHCGTPEYAARANGWGFTLTTISGDSALLAGAAARDVRAYRDLTGQWAPDAKPKAGY